jgi:hypothetical protein
MKLRKKLRVWVVRRFQRCDKPVSKRASAAEVAALDSYQGTTSVVPYAGESTFGFSR